MKQQGDEFAQRLSAWYAPMTFSFWIKEWTQEQGLRSETSRRVTHYVFKLRLDTRSTIQVAVPEGISPGQQIQFTHPLTQQLLTVNAPADGAQMMSVANPPPPKPVTAKLLFVEVPAGVQTGTPFEITHPETQVKMSVTAPMNMTAGSKFGCVV